MVDHFASRVQAARAQTRIRALLVHASSRRRTLGADDAFRSAGRRRTEIALQTRAHGVILDVATLAVRSARRRRAWILTRFRHCSTQ